MINENKKQAISCKFNVPNISFKILSPGNNMKWNLTLNLIQWGNIFMLTLNELDSQAEFGHMLQP